MNCASVTVCLPCSIFPLRLVPYEQLHGQHMCHSERATVLHYVWYHNNISDGIIWKIILYTLLCSSFLYRCIVFTLSSSVSAVLFLPSFLSSLMFCLDLAVFISVTHAENTPFQKWSTVFQRAEVASFSLILCHL